MNRLLSCAILAILLLCTQLHAQQPVLDFKKGNKILKRYWPGEFISFQPDAWNWRKGMIVKIRTDSFFIRPMVVTYRMYYSDTSWFPVEGYSTKGIYAFPKPAIQIDYKDGIFQVSRNGGHMHWYWVKSGWIFRAGALGYAGLHVTNGVIKNDFRLADSKKQLISAAGVFLGGWLLKKTWKPYIRVRGSKRVTVTIL